MSTEPKKKGLVEQLKELNSRRAEFSETELLDLSLKNLNDAGIPPNVVLEYFKSMKEIADSQNSDIKTVSENFMKEIQEHPEEGYFEKKIEEEKENLRSLREKKIRVITDKPAGVF